MAAAMMRIAIAGAGGFAYILAEQISQGANALLILSTQAHPEFEEDFPGCQVAEVDYNNVQQLRYTLQGVDMLISTIGGAEQLNVIDAARLARVRFFVPSEFEGCIAHRPANDPLDRGSEAAMEVLRRLSQSRSHPMQYTVFTCGILMERFAPGGLLQYNMGGSSGVQMPGDYLVDIQGAAAEIVETNGQGRPVQVCMTSVYDVARFVAAAIEIGPRNWPREYRMRGDQMTVRDIVGVCSNFRGAPFNILTHSIADLQGHADYSLEIEDLGRWHYFQRLIATANGRYNFRQANLNEAVNQSDAVDVRPLGFRAWLELVWGSG